MLAIALSAVLTLLTGFSTAPSRDARIEIDRGASYRLSAVVSGEPTMAGTYTLAVTRTGAAGTSLSRQGGAFEVAGRDPQVLSTLTVSVAPGDQVEATLTVTWSDGQIDRQSVDETV